MRAGVKASLLALSIGVLAAQPAGAASLVIDDTAAAEPNIIFNVGQFEFGFQINGTTVETGLGSVSVPVAEDGGFIAGSTMVSFSGSWILGGPLTPTDQTIFFMETGSSNPNQVSDVLHFSYTTDANGRGHLDGYIISDSESNGLNINGLAGHGITPTGFGIDGAVYAFNNTNITASFQSDAVPEPATWAMMAVGFAALGYGALRRTTRQRSSALA